MSELTDKWLSICVWLGLWALWAHWKMTEKERCGGEKSRKGQQWNMNVNALCKHICVRVNECAWECVSVWNKVSEVVSFSLWLIPIREFAKGCLNYNSCWLIYTHTHKHNHKYKHTHTSAHTYTHSSLLALCAAPACEMIKHGFDRQTDRNMLRSSAGSSEQYEGRVHMRDTTLNHYHIEHHINIACNIAFIIIWNIII